LLGQEDEVVLVRNREGNYTTELSASEPIQNLLKRIGSFDALVGVAGTSRFGKIDEASLDDFIDSINN
jgi:hypothetical protein